MCDSRHVPYETYGNFMNNPVSEALANLPEFWLRSIRMSGEWAKGFVCLFAAIGYAQQLFAGTSGAPFERVIWPEDPQQIEAYCDIHALLAKSFERWNA